MLFKEYKTDVTVVGGGFSGVCTAVAAARQGLSVALIQDRPTFGGNSGSNINVGISGAAHSGGSPSVYTKEGGICEEVKLEIAHFGSRDLAYYEAIYREKNIISFLNTVVYDVEKDADTIKAVTAVQLSSEHKFRFESPIFIDASGDGFMAFEAGAEFMWGREARDKFGESLAPEKADNTTMGDSIMFNSIDTGHPVKFHRPSFAYDITKTPFFKTLSKKDENGLHRFIFRRDSGVYNGFWWVEFGGQLNTIYDNAEITLELRKIVYGIWDYIKNSGEFEGVENLEISHMPTLSGKRESRRFIGDTIITQNDLDEKRDFEDRVAIGGWDMDVHAPKGIYDEGPASRWYYVAGSYNIPFSAMYSKNIKNLMFAGRNMSSSHIAFGSTRVACTGGVTGQAVGTAAGLCIKYAKTPRQIKNEHIDELRTILLNADQTIIGEKEPSNKELIKDLKITATTTKKYENSVREANLKLNREIGLALPVDERLDSLKIGIKNNDEKNAQLLKVKIYGGYRKENYIPNEYLGETFVEIQQGFDGWKEIKIGYEHIGDNKIYMVFEQNDNLELYATNRKLTGAHTFVIDPNTESEVHDTVKYAPKIMTFRGRMLKPSTDVCFCDVEPSQNIYAAENVVNGFSRPYGLPNLWISDEKAHVGDQSITFEYSVPKNIKEMHLIFNNLLEEDHSPKGTPYCLVKDYKLEVICTDNSHVIEVKDNYQRVNYIKQEFKNVKKIRLTFTENYGSEYYELYAVKLF